MLHLEVHAHPVRAHRVQAATLVADAAGQGPLPRAELVAPILIRGASPGAQRTEQAPGVLFAVLAAMGN